MADTLQDPPEVLSRIEGGLGRLTLNRPQALHALNRGMIELLTAALLAWRDDPAVRLVLIDHTGERGFCAGGDIRALAASAREGGRDAQAFFLAEYRLNHLLAVYPKPVVAVMDGITMGGGVGLSLPARYRIATERTTFAMPETGIGLFPDVGGGWWLSRLPGQTGLWLALTGARIKAADCLALGLATDFIQSASLPAFTAALARDPDAVETLLTEFEADPGPSPAAAHRTEIDHLFAGDSLDAIFARLAADPSPFAADALKTLDSKSPQTLAVALRELRTGAGLSDFADEMRMEYRIASRVILRPDFCEGVRAVIVDKDNAPKWNPPAVAGVTPALLDAIFAPLPAGEEWTPL